MLHNPTRRTVYNISIYGGEAAILDKSEEKRDKPQNVNKTKKEESSAKLNRSQT